MGQAGGTDWWDRLVGEASVIGWWERLVGQTGGRGL